MVALVLAFLCGMAFTVSVAVLLATGMVTRAVASFSLAEEDQEWTTSPTSDDRGRRPVCPQLCTDVWTNYADVIPAIPGDFACRPARPPSATLRPQ
ncbi:hypothetical protein [Aeromicrobium sp. JJY06]|uniref:hypothetical protein n=1 Tax=Aeromicrobium sp. JJY06 TaxID=3373478 RepID=UPI00376F2C44